MNEAFCPECYARAADSRATPLLHPQDCLKNHTQYICGTCGRCICIECEKTRGVWRWSFPFRSAEVARLYLRAADFTMKTGCGVYEIADRSGRLSCKIFADEAALHRYLLQNRDKRCEAMAPVFTAGPYTEYPRTEIRRLTAEEAARYLAERDARRGNEKDRR